MLVDAILLCMKKRGIRFFSSIKFPNTIVMRFHKKDNFLGLLRRRMEEFDNVLLMAHGSSKGILITTNNPNHQYTVYISIEESCVFKNDFVFAVSCSTVNEFGQSCVDKGAIAYLGYQVEIGGLFSSYSEQNFNIPKRINTAIDTIIKRIFIEELSYSYERFLREPISVQLLKEIFSFSIEKRISHLLNMSPEQIFNSFKVPISERDYKKYVVGIVLNALSYLDEVSQRLICIGDGNYISASYFVYRKQEGVNSSDLLNELETNQFFIALQHEPYKAYLRNLIYKT